MEFAVRTLCTTEAKRVVIAFAQAIDTCVS